MDEIICLSSGSDDEEVVSTRNVKDKRFRKLWEMAKTIMFSKISLKEEFEFPYASLKELFVVLKNKLSEIYSDSLKSFVLSNVLQWLQAMKFNYHDIYHDEKFNFILVDFMALYINHKCKLNYKSDTFATVEYVINEILTALNIIFNEKSTYIIMTLLKVEVHKKYAVILYPVFKKILSDSRLYSANDMIRYILLILAYRQWKMLVSDFKDKEDIHSIAEGKTKTIIAPEEGRVTSLTPKRVIPKKVPIVNDTSSPFTTISDLIGYAIRCDVNGTRVLLTNQTMDFPAAVENFFNQFEHHINQHHSTQRISIDVNRCSNEIQLIGNNINQRKGLSIHQSTPENRSREMTRDENWKVQHLPDMGDNNNTRIRLCANEKRVNNIISRLRDAISRHTLNKSTKDVKDGYLENSNESCSKTIRSGDVLNISSKVTQRSPIFTSSSSDHSQQLKLKTPLKHKITQFNDIQPAVNPSTQETLLLNDRIPFCIQGEVSSTTYSDNQSLENIQHHSPQTHQTDSDTVEKEDSDLSKGSVIKSLKSEVKSSTTVELVESTSLECNTEQYKAKYEETQYGGNETNTNEGESQYSLAPFVFELGQRNYKKCQIGIKLKTRNLQQDISSGPLACTEVSSSANGNHFQSEQKPAKILNKNIQKYFCGQKLIESELLEFLSENTSQIKPSGEGLSKDKLKEIEDERAKRRQSIMIDTDIEWEKIIKKCNLGDNSEINIQQNNEFDQTYKSKNTNERESNRIIIENSDHSSYTLTDPTDRYTKLNMEDANKLDLAQNCNKIELNENMLTAVDFKSTIDTGRKLFPNELGNLKYIKEHITGELIFSEKNQLNTKIFSPIETNNEEEQSEMETRYKNNESIPLINQMHPAFENNWDVFNGIGNIKNEDINAGSIATLIYDKEGKRQYENEMNSDSDIQIGNKIDKSEIYIPDIKLPYVSEVECENSCDENSRSNSSIEINSIITVNTSEKVEQQLVAQKMLFDSSATNIGQTAPLHLSHSTSLDIGSDIRKLDLPESNELNSYQKKIHAIEKHSNLIKVCASIDSNIDQNPIAKISDINFNLSQKEYINNSHTVQTEAKIQSEKMTIIENNAGSHESKLLGYMLSDNPQKNYDIESNNQRNDSNHAQTPFKWRLKRKLSECYNLNEFSDWNSSQESIATNKCEDVSTEMHHTDVGKAKSVEVFEHNNEMISKFEKNVYDPEDITRKYAESCNEVKLLKQIHNPSGENSIEYEEIVLDNRRVVPKKYAEKSNEVTSLKNVDNSLGDDLIEDVEKKVNNPQDVIRIHTENSNGDKSIKKLDSALIDNSVEHDDKGIFNPKDIPLKYAENSTFKKIDHSLSKDSIEQIKNTADNPEDLIRIHAESSNEVKLIKHIDRALSEDSDEHEEINKTDNSKVLPRKYPGNFNEYTLLRKICNSLKKNSIECVKQKIDDSKEVIMIPAEKSNKDISIQKLDSALSAGLVEDGGKKEIDNDAPRKHAENSNEDMLLKKINDSLGYDSIEHRENSNEEKLMQKLDSTLCENSIQHVKKKISNPEDVFIIHEENSNEDKLMQKLDSAIYEDSIQHVEKNIGNAEHGENSNEDQLIKNLDSALCEDSIEQEGKGIDNTENVPSKYAENSIEDMLLNKIDNSLDDESIEQKEKNIENPEDEIRIYVEHSNEDMLIEKLDITLNEDSTGHAEKGVDNPKDVLSNYTDTFYEVTPLKKINNSILLGDNLIKHEEKRSLIKTSSQKSTDLCIDVRDFGEKQKNWMSNLGLCRNDCKQRDSKITHSQKCKKESRIKCMETTESNIYSSPASSAFENFCRKHHLELESPLRLSNKRKSIISKVNKFKNNGQRRNECYKSKYSNKYPFTNSKKANIDNNLENPIQNFTLKSVKQDNHTESNNTKEIELIDRIPGNRLDALIVGDKDSGATSNAQSKSSVEGEKDDLKRNYETDSEKIKTLSCANQNTVSKQIPFGTSKNIEDKSQKLEARTEKNETTEKSIYTSTESNSNVNQMKSTSESVLGFNNEVENTSKIKSVENKEARKVSQKRPSNYERIKHREHDTKFNTSIQQMYSKVNANAKTTCGGKKSEILYAKSVLPIQCEKSIKKQISENITPSYEQVCSRNVYINVEKEKFGTISFVSEEPEVKKETANASVEKLISKDGKRNTTIEKCLESKLLTDVNKRQKECGRYAPQEIVSKEGVGRHINKIVSESNLSKHKKITGDIPKSSENSITSEKGMQKDEGKILQNHNVTSTHNVYLQETSATPKLCNNSDYITAKSKTSNLFNANDEQTNEKLSQSEVCTDIVTKSCFVKIKNTTLDRLKMQESRTSRKRDNCSTKDIKNAGEPKLKKSKHFSKKNWNYEKNIVRNSIQNFNLTKLENNMELLLKALSSLPKKPSIEAYFILNKIIVTIIYEFLSDCSKLTSGRNYLYICTKTKELQAENVDNAKLLDIENKYKKWKKNAGNLVALEIIQCLDKFLIKFITVKKFLFNDVWISENKHNIQNYTCTVPIENVIINKINYKKNTSLDRTNTTDNSIKLIKERDYSNTEELETDTSESINESKINLVQANDVIVDKTSCLNSNDLALSCSKINKRSEISVSSDVLLSGPDADFNLPMYQKTMSKLYEIGNSNADSMLEPCLFDSVVENSSDSKLDSVELQKNVQVESITASDEWGEDLFDCLQNVAPQSDLNLSTRGHPSINVSPGIINNDFTDIYYNIGTIVQAKRQTTQSMATINSKDFFHSQQAKSCDMASIDQPLSFEVDSDVGIKSTLPSFDFLEDDHAVNLENSAADLHNVIKSTSRKIDTQMELGKNIKTAESVLLPSLVPSRKHNGEIESNVREQTKVENNIPLEKKNIKKPRIVTANGIRHFVQKSRFVCFDARIPTATSHVTQKSKSKLVPFPFWKKTTEKQEIDKIKCQANEDKLELIEKNKIQANDEKLLAAFEKSIQKAQTIRNLRNVNDNGKGNICIGKQLAHKECDSYNPLDAHAVQNKFTNLAQTTEPKHV